MAERPRQSGFSHQAGEGLIRMRIKIGIHNHGPRHRYDRVEDSLEAVQRWDERIGFCPDTGHYMRSGEDPVKMVHQLKDRLYGMHLKDHDGIHRDGPPETILGEGAIDLEGLCEAIREVGFNEPISLEYELNPQDPIDDIRQGLDNFAKAAQATA
jgi:inosose dehydratase